ncbi:MAG: DUF3108 domain-containing protein [Pseudomonadota bacterium]
MRTLVGLTVWLMLCSSASLHAAEVAPRTAASSPAASSPSRMRVSYDVYRDNLKIASMSETYTRNRDHYQLESVSKPLGLLAMLKPEIIRVTSHGTVTAKGLRPTTFITKRKLDTERNTRADFNWASGQITLTDNAGQRTLPLPADTQDRLSAMYQFLFLSFENTSEFSFHMTNGSKVDIYNYHVTPNQSVTVPLGTFKAWYLVSPAEPGASQTEVWLAAEHANFPYKMVITDPNGDKFIQLLTQLTVEP